MNKVVLCGRLTKDVEYKATANSGYANFSLAVDRPKGKDQQETSVDFINCTAWGKIGETIAKYLGKGRRVLLEGRIQVDSYEKNGQKQTSTKVIVTSFEFVDSKQQSAPFDEEIPF